MIDFDMAEPDPKFSFTISRQKVLDALARVSGFKNVTASKPRNIGIGTALREIQSDLYSEKIAELREVLSQSPERYRELKKTLPAFTFSGEFSERKKDSLMKASGFLALDFDHVSDLNTTINDLTNDLNVWFYFVSPSGCGIKVGFYTAGIASDADHQRFFRAASNYIERTHGLIPDPSGKDICRLCFVSHDSQVYVADSPLDFDIERWLPVERQAKVYQHPSSADKSDSTRRRYGSRVLQTACSRISSAPLGERNRTRIAQARVVAGYVASGCLDEDEALETLLQAAGSNTDNLEQAERDIRGAFGDGLKCPIEPDLTIAQKKENDSEMADEPPSGENITLSSQRVLECLYRNQIGDAQLFRELFRGKFLYDHSASKWYQWQGHFWREDKIEAASSSVQSVNILYEQELSKISASANSARAAGQQDGKFEMLEKMIRGRLTALRTRSRVADILALARQGVHGLATSGSEWDKNPLLLPCLNGVLNLETGEFREGRPDDLVLTHCDADWKGENEPCPVFERFMTEIMDNDTDLVAFLQRLLGYCLSGLVAELIFPIFYGESGRNGKTTLLEVLHHVLGDLSGSVPAETILSSDRDFSGGGARPDLLLLRGKRLTWCSETGRGRTLDVAKVKLMSGGDSITCRALYGSMTTFQQTSKNILLTNHIPKIDATDAAIWHRIILVPFLLSFVDAPRRPNERKRNQHLLSRLKEESPGILSWLYRGFKQWKEQGLNPPGKVRMATDGLRRENSTVDQFIESQCLVMDGVRVKANSIFEAYQKFCESEAITAESQNGFFRYLKTKFESERKRDSRWYLGIGLKNNESEV